MKRIYALAILFFCIVNTALIAQETTNPWSIEVGLNEVDLYPVGESMPQGEYFDEFFNVNDHWNLGVYIAATRDFTKHLSFSARASISEISKWGDFGSADESALVENLEYYGLDGMINYSFTNNKLKPFIAVGGGYTWIVEGPYNTFSTANGSKNLVGAGTVNGAVGVNYEMSEHFGLNLQFMYKHSFEDYLVKHWQHSLGVTYKLGKSKEVKKEVVDTDGDGVEDAYDLCPNQYGLATFAGCPDTDGDGVPDSLDKCPNNETGTGIGCKEPKLAPTPVKTVIKPTSLSKTVYFNINKADLDNNAKVIVDDIVAFAKNGSLYTIEVSGHTDDSGSAQYNNSLSLERANNIKNYIESKGVSSSNISIKSYGEDQPATSNATSVGKSLNRRAELVIKVTAK